ncbi:MAG: NapC/NirT family cytochrome c [Acidobacteria bacterium]|nr:NapC/NirT family cytochrome c [Acidobacteriota bacterium]
MNQSGSGSQNILRPLVHLTNNPLSLIGVVLVTTAAILLVFLAPSMWAGSASNPYLGILIFLGVPSVFIAGLVLIPAGIILRKRREKAQGSVSTAFPPLDLANADFRRLLIFVGLTSVVNLVLVSQIGYGATSYMESVEFCGQTCHTVMQPEFTAYQNSPHSRVECVKCHIGPGAGWFVKSKLSGVGQVFAVTFNSYPRPIPTPVHNLRPARETCETCHWPQKYGGDRLRVINKFGDDEGNSQTKTVLLMHIGGGNGNVGIHGVHLGAGVQMRYAPADESRQSIPVVEYNKGDGKWVRFVAQDAKPEVVAKFSSPDSMRTMDCMDCHNRPSHTYQLPDRALDAAMSDGAVSPSLPFVKKESLELLKGSYATHAEAAQKIAAGFEKYYSDKYPAVYAQRKDEILRSAKGVVAVYQKNVFPEMRVTWGAYPNNLGHADFPGCFRCHDDQHVAQDGQKIVQDCSACHSMLAMDEAAPKVLTDLGVSAAPKPAGQ